MSYLLHATGLLGNKIAHLEIDRDYVIQFSSDYRSKNSKVFPVCLSRCKGFVRVCTVDCLFVYATNSV